jgi:1-acyl-sn-glycerol-3-phosphate acyltransferase
MIYEICRFLSWLFLRVGFDLRAEFKQQNVIPRGKPFILAANHHSYLDPPAVGCLLMGINLHYLAKAELYENKLSAALLRQLHTIPLYREANDIRAIRQSLKVLEKYPLLLFPQGTRGQDFESFKNGVGFLAKKAKVPVVVAKIHGTEQILPKGAKKLSPGKIRVIYDRVDILPDDDYQQIAAKVVEKIKEL